MSGERDIKVLLKTMSPRLNPGRFVFVTVTGAIPLEANPIVTVSEPEGTTLVLPAADADRHGLAYEFVAAWITLTVHSALDAVGLTAAVSTALADAGISCNVVAGYFHDHLFVPHDAAAAAIQVLSAPGR